MTGEREARNIELVKKWQDTWNNAIDRMVDECYAPDCTVVNMITGYTMHGREQLRAIEHAMMAFDGTRRMDIYRMVASGDQVAIEMDAYWGEARSKACVFLTFNDEGFIVKDNSYGEDVSGASTPGSENYLDQKKA
jgi:limonene-1,2-epoxide hydrolase